MEERTVANLGRGDDAGETTLAAATAAIITARWGAPSRAHRTPARSDDFAAASGLGARFASPAPVSPVPVPVPVIPESNVPFSPFTPVSPAAGPVASAPPFVSVTPPVPSAPPFASAVPFSPARPYSPAPPVAPAPPVSPAPSVAPAPSGPERFGGRASVGGDRRLPPPLPDGFDAVYTPNGHTADNGYGPNGSNGNGSHAYPGADPAEDGYGYSALNGDASNGFNTGALPGRTPGGTVPPNGYGASDDFKAFAAPGVPPLAAPDAPSLPAPERGPSGLSGLYERGGPDRQSAKDSYRGAASPPPMFTPATSIPVPEVFSGQAAGSPHPFPPDPYPPAEPLTVSEPPTVTASGLLAAASASAAALLDSGRFDPFQPDAGPASAPTPLAPRMPSAPPAPPPPVVASARVAPPAPQAHQAPAAPLAPPTHDEFAGSVMSGMTLPKPFVAEPYDPGAFSLPDYDLLTADQPAPERELVGAGVGAAVGRPVLPKRVPSIPDVPDMFLPNDPTADGFELTKISSFFRDGRIDATDDRPDGFDVTVVLQAVRSVPGVKEAHLRWNSGYGHTLRVEFVPGADEGEVTREVGRMLRETMGLTTQAGPAGGYGATIPGTRLSPEENTLERQRRSSGLAPSRSAQPAGGRVVLDHVQVTTLGMDTVVDVRLTVAGGQSAGTVAKGTRKGPAVDEYRLRLAADAAADAIDQLLLDPGAGQRGRCVIDHVAVVPFGAVEVAVVVALLMTGAEATKLSGSAIVASDPRHAVVTATLSAVNGQLETLLP
jgi:hypothetical protein